MFTINGYKANDILTPIVLDMATSTPKDIELKVRRNFSEDWFNTKTASLKGDDNRLAHRIRSIRAQDGITL